MTRASRPGDLPRPATGRARRRAGAFGWAAARVAILAFAVAACGAGCSGGGAAGSSDASGDAASKSLPAPSVRDLEQLNREFLELQRLGSHLEAQLATVGNELRGLEAMSRDMARQEAVVQRLIATVSGKLPASPLAGPDPIYYAKAWGPYGVALLILWLLWKIRGSRLREPERRPGDDPDEPEERA